MQVPGIEGSHCLAMGLQARLRTRAKAIWLAVTMAMTMYITMREFLTIPAMRRYANSIEILNPSSARQYVGPPEYWTWKRCL